MRAALPSIGTCELRQDSELPLCTAQVNNRLISQRCRVKQSVILTPNFPCDAEWGDKLKCLKLTVSGGMKCTKTRLLKQGYGWHKCSWQLSSKQHWLCSLTGKGLWVYSLHLHVVDRSGVGCWIRDSLVQHHQGERPLARRRRQRSRCTEETSLPGQIYLPACPHLSTSQCLLRFSSQLAAAHSISNANLLKSMNVSCFHDIHKLKAPFGKICVWKLFGLSNLY